MKNILRGIWMSILMALAAVISGNVMAKGGFVDFPFVSPSPPTISNEITNPWWSFAPGDQFVYFEEEECTLGIVEVLSWVDPFNKEVKGVRVRTVLDREYEYIGEDEDCDDGEADYANPDEGSWELLEITYDWYAQDDGGNVWYFGEDSVAFDHDGDCDHFVDPEDEELGCRDGSWEAGWDIWAEEEDLEILEGIIMLAEPEKGQFYFQEFWEDEATDMGKVLNFKPVDDTIYGDMERCLVTKEWVPLEPGEVEHKYYCKGYGLVLIEGNAGGPTVFEELIFDKNWED